MKPDRFVEIPTNGMGIDQDGKYVLVTNQICALPHADTEVYQASHDDGCLMTPYEGLVFDMDGDTVTGWHMEIITDRPLSPVGDDKAAGIRSQMEKIIEAAYRGRRH